MPLPTLQVAADRIRHVTDTSTSTAPRSKRSQPSKQSSDSAARKKQENDDIQAAVDEWVSYTTEKAAELSRRFDKAPNHFLNRFFTGGQKLVYRKTATNSFNAFKSVKAAQLRADGEKENAISIQREYLEEYNSLTDEQRAKYVAEFEDMKEKSKRLPRVTARGCIQDVANVSQNIQGLLSSLKTRVGIDGFFCLVRNNANFHMAPVWYFTAEEFIDYMPIAVGKKWSLQTVAAKLEAFAIAGCDLINLNRTSQQKALALKREITAGISASLVAVTGNEKAVMHYTNYEDAIVRKLGVQLVGWTAEKFCNPSNLGSSLIPLRTLAEAVRNGQCKFVKLSPEERRAHEKKYRADVASGAIVVKERKTRKDAGVKRKVATEHSDRIGTAKRVRSDSVIDSDSDSGESDSENPSDATSNKGVGQTPLVGEETSA